MTVIILLPLLSQNVKVFSSCFVTSPVYAVGVCDEVSCGSQGGVVTVAARPTPTRGAGPQRLRGFLEHLPCAAARSSQLGLSR